MIFFISSSLSSLKENFTKFVTYYFFWIVAAVSDVPNFYFSVWFEKDLQFAVFTPKMFRENFKGSHSRAKLPFFSNQTQTFS